VAPPSVKELEGRLRARGTEKEEDIAKRLANSRAEMEYGTAAGNFDKVVVNDDLGRAFGELAGAFVDWYPQLRVDTRAQ